MRAGGFGVAKRAAVGGLANTRKLSAIFALWLALFRALLTGVRVYVSGSAPIVVGRIVWPSTMVSFNTGAIFPMIFSHVDIVFYAHNVYAGGWRYLFALGGLCPCEGGYDHG